jgi:ornithine carbamoyltransferase
MSMPVILPSSPQAAVPSAAAQQTLLARARLLQQAQLSPEGLPRLLQGRRLGLLCAGPAEAAAPQAELFQRAAEALGAQVVRLQPALDLEHVEDIGRMLGRLYDAVECQGLAPAMVLALARAAGVPVFDALAGPHSAGARLVSLLAGPGAAEDKRRWLLQAALVEGLG